MLACLLLCLSLIGCGLSGVSVVTRSDRIPTAPTVTGTSDPNGPSPVKDPISYPGYLSFPKQLLRFEGPYAAFGPDGKAWDAYGIGGPSNVLFVNGNYWICVSGYPSAGFTAQAIGCWYGPGPMSLKPYPGNPVLTNSHPHWAASCMEGPDLNTDGERVYVSYLGFSSTCDGEGPGTIGISSTSVADFPAGLSALTTEPQISKPSNLNWLYRPFLIEIGGICYDYSNAGTNANVPVIVSFRTTGTCAETEMRPEAWSFNRVELTIGTQSWEGAEEIQDPQVIRQENGTFIMVYGGGDTSYGGYAFTTDPVKGLWVKLDSNPIQAAGVLWLPRIMQDSQFQYWMFGNYNNTTQMNLWKAVGP